MIVYFKDTDNVFGNDGCMGKYHEVEGRIIPFESHWLSTLPCVRVPIKGRSMLYSIELRNVIIYDFKRYYDNAVSSL